jgi:hypothetical protein
MDRRPDPFRRHRLADDRDPFADSTAAPVRRNFSKEIAGQTCNVQMMSFGLDFPDAASRSSDHRRAE